MELISDILLVAGALGAGLYCFILARRLKRFTDLERGVGGAVSVLSAQAEELRKSLDAAGSASDRSGQKLQDLTARAERVAQRLELIMASMHDVIPEEKHEPAKPRPPTPETEDAAQPDTNLPEDRDTSLQEPADNVLRDPAPFSENRNDSTAVPKGLMFFRHTSQRGEAPIR